jgi:hypothetical protein
MFLDTVNNIMQQEEKVAAKPLFERWESLPHSRISHHGGVCCERAKEWFLAMDWSMLAGNSPLTGPRWIRQQYNWGPSTHPIHWCEAVKQKSLDCGSLAALAYEAFRARGVKAFPVQLVQQYSIEATDHWGNKWNANETSTHWINKDVIYHEGCAVVLADNSIKIWDASAAWWMNPAQVEGYGSLLALCIHTPGSYAGTELRWGERRIQANQWVSIHKG